MALDRDPFRTLGLPRGASQAEIKAAYRRLAKTFHPDAAGEAAVPRFLAIQAAYETLTGTAVRRPAGTDPRDGGSEPRTDGWRADPDRARATREAWRARGSRAPGGSTGRPPRNGTGTRPTGGGAPPPSPDEDAAGTGAPGRTGARFDRRHAGRAPGTGGPDAGPEPGPGDGSAAPRSGRRPGGAAGGSSDAGARKSRSRPRTDRRPDRATPGSTTYDFADQEPFDPEWSGASWYGTTSGTYWTINPKEYADPRKHGPEYLARARRRAAGEPIDDETVEENRGPGGVSPPQRAAPRRRAASRRDRDGERAPRGGPHAEPSAADAEGAPEQSTAAAADAFTDQAAEPAARAASGGAPRAPRGAAPRAARGAADAGQRSAGRRRGAAAQAAAAGSRPHEAGPGSVAARDPRAIAGRIRALQTRRARRAAPLRATPGLRLAVALVGWPPLGFALAGILGDVTGCSRFAAACGGDAFGLATWLIQLGVIGVLVAFPRLAAISAVGTVAAVAASLPATMLLSSTGGPGFHAASVAALLTVLAIAYVAGVAFAAVTRSRTIDP